MFVFEPDKCYRMPAHFGGSPFNPDEKTVYHDVTLLAFRYRTEPDRLTRYLPEGFELLAPELMVGFQQCREVDWMAGSSYNLIQVAVPARFVGRRDRLDGAYVLVIWENKTTPILTGRDMGMPKIFSDIEDLHIVGGTYRTCASYEGSTFLTMEMVEPKPMPDEQARAMSAETNAFGWRYVQKIGGPGAEVSQPTLFPMGMEVTEGWTGTGTLDWIPLSWQQNPMQWHIIAALAELPMLELAPVTLTRGQATLRDARGRVLA